MGIVVITGEQRSIVHSIDCIVHCMKGHGIHCTGMGNSNIVVNLGCWRKPVLHGSSWSNIVLGCSNIVLGCSNIVLCWVVATLLACIKHWVHSIDSGVLGCSNIVANKEGLCNRATQQVE